MENYLEKLPLSDEEKTKLGEFAAESPASLLGLIHANQTAFRDYFGAQKTSELEYTLRKMISNEDIAVLRHLPKPNFGLGAVVGKNPEKLRQPGYDIEKRERLYEELKYLKSQDANSGQTQERISEITEELNKMLK